MGIIAAPSIRRSTTEEPLNLEEEEQTKTQVQQDCSLTLDPTSLDLGKALNPSQLRASRNPHPHKPDSQVLPINLATWDKQQYDSITKNVEHLAQPKKGPYQHTPTNPLHAYTSTMQCQHLYS